MRRMKRLAAKAASLALVMSLGFGTVVSASAEKVETGFAPTTDTYLVALANAENVTREIAEEGMILLKNNGALPMNVAEGCKITVLGRNSVEPVYGGSGSAGGGMPKVDVYNSLWKAGFTVNPVMEAFYRDAEKSSSARPATPAQGSMPSGYAVAETPMERYTDAEKQSCADYADAALVFISRIGGEGYDLPTTSYLVDEEGNETVVPGRNDASEHYLELDQNEKDLIAFAKENFDKVVIVLNAGTPLELGSVQADEGVDAILWAGCPGVTGFEALGEILNGTVNPSGRTVDTYAADFTASPAWQNFAVNAENGRADAANNTLVLENGEATKYHMVEYEEGIYVGYRYYETRGFSDGEEWYAENVVYPFGYGLSYTTFEQNLDNLNVDLENETVTANVTVKNTGSVAGKDVVQLYVSLPYTDYDKEHGVEKAAIQLLDYGKTAELAPGASETVTITADMQNMASWDSTADNAAGTKGCYILDAGDYWFTIGNGAHEAVNNVLAAEGQSVDGTADKAKSWTLDSFDGTTFATTKNGTAVENQLADMGINSWLPGTATYLTRSDWEGTFPKTYKNLTASDEMLDILDNDIYEINANGDPASVTFGADNGLTLADLKGVTDLDDERWSLLMDQLTLEEGMIRLGLGGTSTKAIESIMSPETIQNDGPNGIYSYPLGQYANTDKASGDPCAVDANDPNLAYKFGTMVNETVIAQTFNKDLANEYGKICGNYSLWSNLTIFWGCGTNLHRSPYNARNHEYYSEDAVLTSGQAVAFISGGKEYGVIIAPKHLAFNDTEINRTGVSVFMTEQQARENELRGTQAAIEDAGALGVMTAFNRVGITAANAHTGLLKNILRGEWGFKGLESQDFIMNPNYAVLKEYALNGGTMTTFTGENTMAAVSEKFAYWTTENVGQDTELMSAIKQAMTWQAYALANSNALDGMASSTRLVSVRTWYDNALVAVQVVFAALTVLAAAMYVLNDRKSKKQ